MTTYVALLRGINVGGHHKVPMADLRSLLTEAGYGDVRTYIQSGNVVFASRKKAPAVTKDLEQRIAAMSGFGVPVVLRTGSQVRATLENNPYLRRTDDPTKLHVVFFADAVPAGVKEIDQAPFAPEEFTPRGKDLYLYMPDGLGRSKLGRAGFDKTFGPGGTTRNWRTVTKLVEMAEA